MSTDIKNLLPIELWVNIFSYAHDNYNKDEILKLSLICKKWKEIIYDNVTYLCLSKRLNFQICHSTHQFWAQINPTKVQQKRFIEVLSGKNVDFNATEIWGSSDKTADLGKQIKLFALYFFHTYQRYICEINLKNKGLLNSIYHLQLKYDSNIESFIFEIKNLDKKCSKKTKQFLNKNGSKLLLYFSNMQNPKNYSIAEIEETPLQKKQKTGPKKHYLECKFIRDFMNSESVEYYGQNNAKRFQKILEENVDSNDQILKTLALANTPFSKNFFVHLFSYLILESFTGNNPLEPLEHLNRIVKYTNFDLNFGSKFFIKRYCQSWWQNLNIDNKIIPLLKNIDNFIHFMPRDLGIKKITENANYIIEHHFPTSLLSLLSLIPNSSEDQKITIIKKELFDTIIKQQMIFFKVKHYNSNEKEIYSLIANQKDLFGFTPLHYFCAYCKDIYFIKALVEMGADVNAKNRNELTPLHYFAMPSSSPGPSHLKTLDYLFESGANIWALDANHNLPLHYALWMHEKDLASWLINKFIQLGDVKPLLTNNQFGQSPLLLAAWQPEVTALLLPHIKKYQDPQTIFGKTTTLLEFALLCIERNLPKIETMTGPICFEYLIQILQTGFFNINIPFIGGGCTLLTYSTRWIKEKSFKKNIWRFFFDLKPKLNLYSAGADNFLERIAGKLDLIDNKGLDQILDELKEAYEHEEQKFPSLTLKLLEATEIKEERIKQFILNVAKYDKKITSFNKRQTSNLLTYFLRNKADASFVIEILDCQTKKEIKNLFDKATSKSILEAFFYKYKYPHISYGDGIILKWLLKHSEYLKIDWIENLLHSRDSEVWDILLDSNLLTNEFFANYFVTTPKVAFAQKLRLNFFYSNRAKFEEITKKLVAKVPELADLFPGIPQSTQNFQPRIQNLLNPSTFYSSSSSSSSSTSSSSSSSSSNWVDALSWLGKRKQSSFNLYSEYESYSESEEEVDSDSDATESDSEMDFEPNELY